MSVRVRIKTMGRVFDRVLFNAKELFTMYTTVVFVVRSQEVTDNTRNGLINESKIRYICVASSQLGYTIHEYI